MVGTPGHVATTPAASGGIVRAGSFISYDKDAQSASSNGTLVNAVSQSNVAFPTPGISSSEHHQSGGDMMIFTHQSQGSSPAAGGLHGNGHTVLFQPMPAPNMGHSPPFVQSYQPSAHGQITYIQTPPGGNAPSTPGGTPGGHTPAYIPLSRVMSEPHVLHQQTLVNMDQLQPRHYEQEVHMSPPNVNGVVPMDSRKRPSEVHLGDSFKAKRLSSGQKKKVSEPRSSESPVDTTETTASGKAKPFKCTQCPQTFSRSHDLKRHMCIHTGVKPFSCPYCGKAFSRRDALARHVECPERPAGAPPPGGVGMDGARAGSRGAGRRTANDSGDERESPESGLASGDEDM
ncbi:hypothetical protein M427DRAFT_57672 [Gonapodya prolifera JEL478]|uniref:C2H2-type domain-containing protein n=1 Tax=Gonapodya prolifera (strain JEL478) TaxID=1344416 RepID=A0A139ACA4_GONPJ|nr:hypothetical protein M427DRAFT_57672 [Gonapodya prolifera JEL478]|eukprot:KXS14214.1 hypothetical protein M427DRAFT_57672 [Gonapodya prolifera JEL478]